MSSPTSEFGGPPRGSSPESAASGSTDQPVDYSHFPTPEIGSSWPFERDSRPDQYLNPHNDQLCQDSDHANDHACPICYRTISSTSGSSYSSSVHSCEGSLHKRHLSIKSQAESEAMSESKQIVIKRNPVTLAELEKTHAPATKYHAPREIFHRLLPEKVSFWSTVTSVLPVLKWLPNYNVKGDLFADVFAGVTVLAMQIPQGLAYSKLAGVAPIYGIYATLFSAVIYSVMATSRHVSMGLYAITSMMCRNVIANFNGKFDKPPTGIEILITLCFMTGILQTFFGVFRLGNLSLLFSDNFLSAFTVGCSILIFNSQVAPSLGINFPVDENDYLGIPSECINTWISIIKHVKESNPCTLIVSGGVLLALIVSKYYIDPEILVKRFKAKFPIPIDLLVIIATTIISMAADLNGRYQLDIVGEIPSGFAPPELPRFDLVPSLITDAIIMASVASVCQISLAKLASKKYGYSISLNQEFLAYGTSNLVCSFFHSFPTCASLARTGVNENAGARTQLSAMICSSLLILFLFFFSAYLGPLPKCTLSCIIMVAMIPSLSLYRDFFNVYKVSRFDAVLWMVTFLTVTFLGVNIGIVCGLGTSVAMILIRVAIPTSSVKFPLEKSEIYLSPDVYQGLDTQELKDNRVLVFSFQGPLTFLSAATFKTDIRKKALDHIEYERAKMDLNNNNAVQFESKFDSVVVEGVINRSYAKSDFDDDAPMDVKNQPELTVPQLANGHTPRPNQWAATLILDMSQVIHIDVTGIEMLTDLKDDLDQMQAQLLLACCSISVLSTLERAKFFPNKVSKASCFLSVHDGVIAAKQRTIHNQSAMSTKTNSNGTSGISFE